jgi:hypothetical protein
LFLNIFSHSICADGTWACGNLGQDPKNTAFKKRNPGAGQKVTFDHLQSFVSLFSAAKCDFSRERRSTTCGNGAGWCEMLTFS